MRVRFFFSISCRRRLNRLRQRAPHSSRSIGLIRKSVAPASIYRRLASDLGASGCAVIADLAGEFLAAVAAGGVTVLKVSDEELASVRLRQDSFHGEWNYTILPHND